MNQAWVHIRAALTLLGAPHILLVLSCIATMLLANPDPFMRDAICDRGVCFYSNSAMGYNTLFYDFASGALITIIFYWILIRWPEHNKRQRIKRTFAAHYRNFKLACIENFLAVADNGFASSFPEKLLSVQAFRDYFKEPVGDGKNRWHAVANNMSDYYLDVTVSRMEILRQEISFLLREVDLSEGDAFEVLKRLSHAMTLQRNASTDYDSISSFLGFFWELFAGWDFVSGYRERDFVEEIIDTL